MGPKLYWFDAGLEYYMAHKYDWTKADAWEGCWVCTCGKYVGTGDTQDDAFCECLKEVRNGSKNR